MRTILRLAHRLWINFEPYLALAPLKSLPVWGLVVSALTAFWAWVLSTIQAIHGLGWGVWLVLGLVLALLTLLGLVMATWTSDRWHARRRGRVQTTVDQSDFKAILLDKGNSTSGANRSTPDSAQLDEKISKRQAEVRRLVRETKRSIRRGIRDIYK